MIHVDGAGGYVPLYRIDRGEVTAQHGGGSASGESSVPGHDETLVTMASEAAANALARSSIDPTDLGAVYAASVTDPYAEHGIAAQVAYRLDATGGVRTGDLQGSARAAGDGFVTAMHVVESIGEPALVVATDSMPVEPGHDDEAYSGAAAGAVVLAPDSAATDPVATVHGVGQRTTGFVERHREHGEAAEHGDRRVEGEVGFGGAVPGAVQDALEAAPDLPSHVVVQAPDARVARSAVSELPGEVEQVSTFDGVGYAGPASFLLDLTHLLETTAVGTTALAVSYGAGGADAVALSVERPLGSSDANAATTVRSYLDSREYVTYAEHLRYRERPDYQGVTAE